MGCCSNRRSRDQHTNSTAIERTLTDRYNGTSGEWDSYGEDRDCGSRETADVLVYVYERQYDERSRLPRIIRTCETAERAQALRRDIRSMRQVSVIINSVLCRVASQQCKILLELQNDDGEYAELDD